MVGVADKSAATPAKSAFTDWHQPAKAGFAIVEREFIRQQLAEPHEWGIKE